MKVQSIDLDKIDQNENSRVVYKAADLSELMHSMKKDGQLQPVGVRKSEDGRYDAVFGNRRIMAARKLGWASIEAHVMEGLEDDKDRDILNLIENLKRQNTTVAEDGRMFKVLQDHGLSAQEIATRLDISIQRVETAIETLQDIPKEYHKKIVNRQTGKSMKNLIPASVAHEVLQLRKRHNLNRKQVRSLLDFASREEIALAHVAKIAPLMGEGLSLKQAMQESGRLVRITLQVFIDRSKVDRIEKESGLSISENLLRQLEKDKSLGVERFARGHFESRSRAHRGASGRIGAKETA